VSNARIVAWRRAGSGEGHSLGRLEGGADGWLAYGSEILVLPAETLACHFRVELDADWRTRAVHVESVWADGAELLDLRADEQRRWWRDGSRMPELDGCIDVDPAATPLTNTFPIRRLGQLAVGDAHTSPVAWVEVPRLEVRRVEQTYKRLGAVRDDPPAVEAWQYSDPMHGVFRLTVDSDGLVVDYEGFATRVRA
jgi:uncharacterized protein